MDNLLALKALIMGIVEGLTEFLPISSTGHLILASSLLQFPSPAFPTEKVQLFEIVIQAGAIFAVCWEYRVKIAATLMGIFSERQAQRLVLNLIVAFIPAAVLGLLFSKKIKEVLFAPVPVALAFISGALVILWVERRDHGHEAPSRINSVDDITLLDAFKIGCAQALALVPGTSRSGATIIGGMLFGLSRKAASEFSFFLAIPTLFAATVYSLYKERAALSMSDLPVLTIGTVAAFVSAFFCVRWLLRYISTHDFTVFAWYRILFGLVILVTAYTGTVAWVE
ncbi:undecaprenyl-diphosphate phosphatase [Herbaspirillum sp. RTI4]|uniref:undecaprenyl-diphosphate phosphatase n=1 Tax=Herbaspirillum sp. RTI4 TaxID=3048640 RepID=UPI002AB3A77A|nr:undecaprenyl-diphosphate phosphatase [Herbaspirillum sp. RTI4]MDY7577642.1 undecaprenyl-diphosphate phosphatase [Herbaspirillum sp. RTI4]MEA9982192.1 undecaprenyl-diphosphate phosphatase [Herbaspirillum sp. RTI4]